MGQKGNFLGGQVVKNLSADVGDMGSLPAPGKPEIPVALGEEH